MSDTTSATPTRPTLDAFNVESVQTLRPRLLTCLGVGRWADEVLAGPPKGYTDAVLDDEFPLSMFFEALERKMAPVIASTRGITGRDD